LSPRFSLVIPTHNRAHLVALALRSVLANDFDDFEVIVSDDQSTDSTREVVASFSSSRVRHVRTPRRMSMSDHFEWASQQAVGQFLMLLCDDDAVSPDMLARMDGVIRTTGASVVAMRSALYYPPGGLREGRDNLLCASAYTGGAVLCDSHGMLHAMLGQFRYALTPRANNSFTERRLVEQIRSRVGRFFLSPAPDASSSCLVLAHSRSYVLLDEPVHLFGQAPESIGADQEFRRSAPSAEFAAIAGRLFELSPASVYCVTNIIAESYLQARRLVPAAIPPLNLGQLYIGCRRDLAVLAGNGVDVREDQVKLEVWAESLGLAARANIAWAQYWPRFARGRLGSLGRKVKHALAPPPIPIDHTPRPIEIRGDEAGFSDIVECAARLPGLRHLLVDGGVSH
jgi:glycosyltransferase involved in cell wall biosynthesis